MHCSQHHCNNDSSSYRQRCLGFVVVPIPNKSTVTRVPSDGDKIRGNQWRLDKRGGRALFFLDDKYGLVINLVFFCSSEQACISSHREFKESVADVFCRQQAVLAHDCFEFAAVLGVAATVCPVGVKKKNVSGTHQRNVSDIRRAYRGRNFSEK